MSIIRPVPGEEDRSMHERTSVPPDLERRAIVE